MIEERAEANHQRPLFSIPYSTSAADGFKNVSYREFANAVNRGAKWVEENVGHSSEFDTLIYLGPADLRYQIMTLASVKAGFVVGASESCVFAVRI